jgi:hypothetical protein
MFAQIETVTLPQELWKFACVNNWGDNMKRYERPRATFPLRLAVSLRDMANLLSHKDGVSLNQFINIAVAEKISRLEHETLNEQHIIAKQHKLALAEGVIAKSFYD